MDGWPYWKGMQKRDSTVLQIKCLLLIASCFIQDIMHSFTIKQNQEVLIH